MSKEVKKEVGFVTTDQIQEVFEKHINKATFDGIRKDVSTAVANKLNYVLNELLIKASENEEADNE